MEQRGDSYPRFFRSVLAQIQGRVPAALKCSVMQYPWFDGSIEQEFAIRSLAELCGVPTRTSETSKPSGSQSFIMVTCDAKDAEAISTCQVLCHSAQKRTETTLLLVCCVAVHQE